MPEDVFAPPSPRGRIGLKHICSNMTYLILKKERNLLSRNIRLVGLFQTAGVIIYCNNFLWKSYIVRQEYSAMGQENTAKMYHRLLQAVVVEPSSLLLTSPSLLNKDSSRSEEVSILSQVTDAAQCCTDNQVRLVASIKRKQGT